MSTSRPITFVSFCVTTMCSYISVNEHFCSSAQYLFINYIIIISWNQSWNWLANYTTHNTTWPTNIKKQKTRTPVPITHGPSHMISDHSHLDLIIHTNNVLLFPLTSCIYALLFFVVLFYQALHSNYAVIML